MKRLLLLLIAWTCTVDSQTIMHVHRLTGSTSDVNISEISKLTFSETSMQIHGEGSSIALSDLRKLTFSETPTSLDRKEHVPITANQLMLSFNGMSLTWDGKGIAGAELRYENVRVSSRKKLKHLMAI